MKPHFPIVGILAHQILSIVRSQIKTKRNFSLTSILAHLGRSKLQFKKSKKLIFVRKK
jgi:hypothetical protein